MSDWQERRSRAVALMARQPHAEEILGVYVGVLEAQSKVHAWLRGQPPADRTPKVLDTYGPESVPFTLRPFDPAEIVGRYREFVVDVIPIGTPVLELAGSEILREGDTALHDHLLATIAGAVRLSEDTSGFFAEAFLQPVATWMRSASGFVRSGSGSARDRRTCAYCGDLPTVAVLRDDSDVRGRRLLACGRCALDWPYRRVGCVACGETSPGQLVHHVGESATHVRVEECSSCRRYVKTVDLRTDGAAVPLVEDIASPELDLWAAERGLQKVRLNLMGL